MNENESTEIIQTIEQIARQAGDILMSYYGQIHRVEYKGIGDIVTEADKASEHFIKTTLESQFPGYATLGEEFGLSDVQSDKCWVTDPLDGTANYAAGLPIFSVAIGLLNKGIPLLGVVFDPNTKRMFTGIKGRRATLDGTPLHVNNRGKLDPIGLFGYSAEVMKSLHPFMCNQAKGRALGSAALHICSVAAGHFDGSFDLSTKLWDVTAATVILESAGGRISYPSGKRIFPLPPDSPAYRGATVPFLVSNGKIHAECVEVFARVEGQMK